MLELLTWDAQSGAARVLVASDALTRGMDVAGVGAVVNYDAPAFAKTYVHRAGRTARAGQHGKVPCGWVWQYHHMFSSGFRLAK